MNPGSPSLNQPTDRLGLGSRLRSLFLIAVGFLAASVGALLMLLVAIVTLFQARRFYAEVIAKRLGRIALWLSGVSMIVHRDQPLPETQTIYLSNHTSTLDVFILIALGLPNTRYFMSGFLRKILPVGIIGYLIGIFWTVPQRYPEQRSKIFQRAERVLRRTGESVYLSPEGQRVLTGEIGHFNRGSFHLATNLHAPIQPFFIHIPAELNRGTKLLSGTGVVDVYFLPLVVTTDWKLEELDQNRERVREMFVQFHHNVQR